MPFYIKKSVSVGPFRFNLSKSGIGISTGVTGLRFGAGPRGQYVHAGRGGIYYRKTLSSRPEGLLFNQGRPIDAPDPPTSVVAPSQLEFVDSSSVSTMVDATSSELLKELNDKQDLVEALPLVLGITAVVLAGALLGESPAWVLALALTIGASLSLLAYKRDVLKKTVTVLYDLEPDFEQEYRRVYETFEQLRQCGRIWLVEARGETAETRYHAGASMLVRRTVISISFGLPKYVKSNIEVPIVPVGKQALYFFPDALLVQEGKQFGAIGYQRLNVSVRNQHFIEEGTVPQDSKVVERTWKYVNKSGGPDRRFKDNRELPVLQYEEIQFSSETGLNEVLQVSKPGVGAKIKGALLDLSKAAS